MSPGTVRFATGCARLRGGRRLRQSASRRRGIAVIYTALSLASFLGVTALVVDLGNLYTRRTQAQRAADGAALAGALDLPTGVAAATAKAREYARLNGYDEARGEIQEVTCFASSVPPGVVTPIVDTIRVKVQRSEPLYFLPAFAALLGESITSSKVGATAVAQIGRVRPDVDININGGAPFGSSSGFVNPAVFGPYAPYSFGDSYSTYYREDGSPNSNSDPNAKPGQLTGRQFAGYNYKIKIPASAVGKPLQLEIFDPDSYSTGGVDGWDEQRQAPKTDADFTSNITRTRYELRKPNGELIASAIYGGGPGDLDANADGIPDSDLKWTTPDGFTFTPDAAGDYNLNVKTIDGASENGFQLRIGEAHNDPALADPSKEADWIRDYDNGGRANGGVGNGMTITATGKAPMNFTRDGEVDITLGFVPPDAAGGRVFVTKFDTDIGAQRIDYRYEPPGGSPYTNFPPGTLASNGTTNTDDLQVPDTYPGSGAVWYARYVAARSDTSVWEMSFGKKVPPGTVHLIE